MEVYDAVIKAKLLYGMESLQMRTTSKRRSDIFQLKGLRKILRMKTTYGNRNNTNEKVIQTANDKLALERYQTNMEREAQGRKKLNSPKGISQEIGKELDLSEEYEYRRNKQITKIILQRN